MNNELRLERCATAFDCYIKLKQDLSRSGTEEKTTSFLEYETNQDTRFVKNIALIYKRSYIGFATQKNDEYNTLQAHNEYIVFTNWKNVEEMNVIQEIIKISQVSSELQPESDRDIVKW